MAYIKAYACFYPKKAAFKKGALSPLKAKIEPLISCTFRIFHIRTAPFLHSASRPNHHNTSPAGKASAPGNVFTEAVEMHTFDELTSVFPDVSKKSIGFEDPETRRVQQIL